MCWKWSKDLGITPLLLSLLLPEISPLALSGLVKCLTYIFIQDKVSHNIPLGEEKIFEHHNIVDVAWTLLQSLTGIHLEFIIMSDSCF